MKSEIIETFGQSDILLPSLIAEGLAANDRAKARLSVLQAAARHAREPQPPFQIAASSLPSPGCGDPVGTHKLGAVDQRFHQRAIDTRAYRKCARGMNCVLGPKADTADASAYPRQSVEEAYARHRKTAKQADAICVAA